MLKLRRLFPYVLREWPVLAAILALTLVSSALIAAQPWPLKLLVDHALGGAGVPAAVSALLGALSLSATPSVLIVAAAVAGVLVFAATGLVDVALSWAWAVSGQRMTYRLSRQVFSRLQRLSLRFHSRASVGDLLDRLTSDSYCLYSIAGGLLVSPSQQLLTICAVGLVAWRMHPRLALIALAAAPVLAAVTFAFGRALTRRARRVRQAEARLKGFVHQTLAAIPVVQAFGSESLNRSHFRALADEAVTSSQSSTVLRSTHGLITGLSTTIGGAAVLLVGGREVLAGSMTVGDLLVFVAYLRSLQGAFLGVIGTYASLKRTEASVDRVLEIIDSDDEVLEATEPAPLPTLHRGERGHVALESVTFGYEPGQPVLQGVSIDARPGETIALVGPTGAGKSTIASLIPRLYDPWEGRITFDGVDLLDLGIAPLRSQVAIVTQDAFLLPMSVAENIAYGRPSATREEVAAAAREASADEFIRGLPDGYDTVIGEKGATLSGGEKQRISIARAFLKDAPVLVLDEPTSALDAETEGALLEALERLAEGRTTFIIAHRLSTVRQADRIVVLDGGRVVEAGSQAELLAARGLYHRLCSQQMAASPQGVTP